MATNVLKVANGTTSGGGSGGTPFVTAFDATTSWGAPSGGYYSIVVPQSTHQKGTDPTIQVYETVLTNDELIDVDSVIVNSFGDITIRVTENLDARFAGKIVVR